MATFRERTLKSGKTSVTAQIVRRNPAYQESKTFDKRKTAEAWAKKRESEIDAEIAAGRTPKKRSEMRVTLGDAIDKYVDESMREIGGTKAQVLRTIRNEYPIAEMRCDRITAPDIVAFARELHQRPGVGSPATVMNYLSHLSAVFTHAPALWGFQLDRQAMEDAMIAIKHAGIAKRSEERDRRPTLAELDKIMAHFVRASEHDPRCIPMHRIVAFAIFSTRRQAEICRITWEEYDPDAKRVMVRKMKNPGDKGGRDTVVELPDPCASIIAAMPHKKDRIFPFNSDTVSRRFTEACAVLGIEDLHFHDLRHEGASRLAEIGRTVPQLMAVTGHRSMASLDRYTHVRQIGDKYEGWKWLDVVTMASDRHAVS
ncbi:MAG: site-specific integrase [Boseongicola sp.]|nr:site-specific integrase [Boseongicola sp.]MDD9977868.1 site-specific integrase [Boseongicola sp.]